MTFTVRFERRAARQLLDIQTYIASQASLAVALDYTTGIARFAETLGVFPHRGRSRDDVFVGLRVVGHKKRVTVTYLVDDDAKTVVVTGVFYGGQDWENSYAAD